MNKDNVSIKGQKDFVKGNTILIVDDDEINRLLLENIFAPFYSVKHAQNGKIGLDIILSQPEQFCAILLDVIMPQMDGIEVINHLYERDLLSKVPVFLITSEASDAVMKKAYTLGVMDVIEKPVIPYVVLRRVQSIVELYKARKQLSNVVRKQQSELLKRARKIIKLNQGMIEALSTAIEFRSGESGEHVRRIHDITKLMLTCTEFGKGFNNDDIENIALAAIMHDVGKISIPDSILNKPAKLTEKEFEIMKTHTVKGERLLTAIPQMKGSKAYKYACDIARHHHERWDGNGYPDRLKGDEISVWSQIVSLADVYDALVSKRVYKDAIKVDTAIDMIKNGECGKFNPNLLKSFFDIEPAIRKLYVK